jgi:hypothetical protein
MDRRAKFIFLFTGGVIAIAAIAVFIFWPSKPPAPAANANANTNAGALTPSANVNGSVNVNAPSAPRPTSDAEKAASEPKTIAVTFAERFDSYSSQSNLKNLTDLAPLVTADSYQFIDTTYRSKLKKSFPAGNAYLGVSAHVVAVHQISYDGKSADFELNMQEVWSGTVNTTKYPTLEVKLEKDGDTWLVNDFKWK